MWCFPEPDIFCSVFFCQNNTMFELPLTSFTPFVNCCRTNDWWEAELTTNVIHLFTMAWDWSLVCHSLVKDNSKALLWKSQQESYYFAVGTKDLCCRTFSSKTLIAENINNFLADYDNLNKSATDFYLKVGHQKEILINRYFVVFRRQNLFVF